LETIHIYHTNDLHSHFEQWPRIAAFVHEQRCNHKEANEETFLFDIGDHVDRFHPFSDGTKGIGNIELLNKAAYSAVTIGNNEGITFPLKDLDKMYENADFPVLVANLYHEDGTRPNWLRPNTIFTTKKGTRIGVIGLTVNYEHLYHLLGWKLTDPILELRKQIDELKGQTDIFILLSHLGIYEDERIARDFPEIDVIFGAHTHHVLPEGKIINNSILCAAGKYGQYVGRLTLEINNQKIIDRKAIIYDTKTIPPVQQEQKIIDQFFIEGKSLLAEKVVKLKEDIISDTVDKSSLPTLLCEALHEWCEADCAFLNAGLLLDGLKTGIVTRYDLLEICPHPINPCVVELPGKELKAVLLKTMEERWPNFPVWGLGFRGKVMGTFIYSGITIGEIDQETEVFIGIEKIISVKKYKVAIPDMFTFGKFFPEIANAETKEYFLPEFMRDLLEWKLKLIHS
jgi:5'-nucleotidase